MLIKRIILLCTAAACSNAVYANQTTQLNEVVVWGEQQASQQVGYTSPVSTLKPDNMAAINMVTTEDAVKYEPSIVIRRRFIGDSNGTLGIRGSNMFQTSRSMVFADGVPLHYFLESRWNGAPRWTMVSASEIAEASVVYGPFSAEYSGNAMGGVVLMETKIPQKREVHIDATLMSQDFSAYKADERLNGFKGFASYGDKIGDLSLYFSYNHLDNEAQQQSYYFNTLASDAAPTAQGGLLRNDSKGVQKMVFGDNGKVESQTDNYKMKLGYDFTNRWFALLNVAYEDRSSYNIGNTYITDAAGNPVWNGTVSQNEQSFTIKGSSLGENALERNSLNLGLRIKGELAAGSHLELNANRFDVLKNRSIASSTNPADPAFNNTGQITDYGDTGWRTLSAKWKLDQLGALKTVSLTSGLSHEAYELNRHVYASNNYAAQTKNSLSGSSGGETRISAVFAQLGWLMGEQWDSSVGLRYETWQSKNGYYASDDPATPQLDLVHTPARKQDKVSPKLSFGYLPDEDWVIRYSLAKAYRFPIVEELYSQYRAYQSRSLANPGLKPENGLHHNLMIARTLDNGYLRANLFRDNIHDVIESQTTLLDGGGSLRTFIPVDEVQTTGLELIANIERVFSSPLDLRFNLAYTDAEIVANTADPSIVGNTFPRMPKWRSNVLASWHLDAKWQISGSMQYASNSFGQLDNSDNQDQVYAAQDSYTRLGLKTHYQVDQHFSLSAGIDNLTNELSYVAHPWPRRTFFLSGAYDL